MVPQREGVLFAIRQFSLEAAIERAISQFKQHTDGLTPEEIHFPPAETPILDYIKNLKVHADERIHPGFIRVTTRPMTELEREMARFANRVNRETGRLIADCQAA